MIARKRNWVNPSSEGKLDASANGISTECMKKNIYVLNSPGFKERYKITI